MSVTDLMHEQITEAAATPFSVDYDFESLVHPEIYLRDVNNHIQAYKQLGLKAHEDELIFAAKVEQARKIGLKYITEREIADLLVGEYPKPQIKFGFDFNVELGLQFYDPLFKKTFDASMPLYSLSPKFWSFQRWEPIHMVPLSALSTPIPYGFLLRVIELQKLNFFNCFFVFAPRSLVRSEAYQHKLSERMDPVIVATLVNRFRLDFVSWRDKDKPLVRLMTGGEFAHFFIGKW